MSFKTVSIFGCGWLGLPLAVSLVGIGHLVKGSTTSPEKMAVLKKQDVVPFLLNAVPELTGEGIEKFFDAEIAVVALPFRRNLTDPRYYQQQINSIIQNIETSTVRLVIFTSSTSVYPSDIKIATEDADFKTDNPRAQVLWDVEQSFLQNNRFDATVIRFAGLYGGERRIGRFLSGHNDIEGGDQPVNLIHRDDCVGIIQEVIRQDVRGEILNACSDEHPLKKDLYVQAAREMGVEPPKFRQQQSSGGKIVSNRKLKERLNYHFQHPDPAHS